MIKMHKFSVVKLLEFNKIKKSDRKVFHGARTQYQTIADMFVLVVSPGFSLVQTMMTYTRVTGTPVEASLRDGLIINN